MKRIPEPGQIKNPNLHRLFFSRELIAADTETSSVEDLGEWRSSNGRHLPSGRVADFTGWDHAGQGAPCIRASGRRLIVNGCEFMDEGKPALILEKGLKAASVFGCAFRGPKPIDDQSGADVKTGLSTNA